MMQSKKKEGLVDRSRLPANPSSFKRILLIQLGDIGDVILTLPAIRALKENYFLFSNSISDDARFIAYPPESLWLTAH
jgi:hypothetical protein